jgi:uncharacterized membrane protein
MYDRFDHTGSGSGNWFFMVLMMVLVVMAVFFVVHHLSSANHSSNSEDKSLDILNHRYAKGEKGKKQFEKI